MKDIGIGLGLMVVGTFVASLFYAIIWMMIRFQPYRCYFCYLDGG
jgi:hypothetical protein